MRLASKPLARFNPGRAVVWHWNACEFSSNTKARGNASTSGQGNQRRLLPGQFLVGPPHPVSNIRAVKFYIPPDETPQERRYREQREDAVQKDHEFWLDNNRRFEQGKEEFERAALGKSGVDELSVYYKQYQEESFGRHLAYNRYVWRRNLAMVVPGVRAWWQEVWRRRKRKGQAVAVFSEQGFFDREDDGAPEMHRRPGTAGQQDAGKLDRRAEKIKSYY